MITAEDALKLDRAQITSDEARNIVEVLEELEQHIRETMTFSGLKPVHFLVPGVSALGVKALHTRILSDVVAKAVILQLTKGKWLASCNLMSTPSRFQGGEPDPHHWTFSIVPMVEAYGDIPEPKRLLS